MTDFVRVKHPGIKDEATVAATALEFLGDGWQVIADPETPAPTDDRNVDQVLADVGADPGKAAAELAAEQARPKTRRTLIDSLTALTSQES